MYYQAFQILGVDHPLAGSLVVCRVMFIHKVELRKNATNLCADLHNSRLWQGKVRGVHCPTDGQSKR